jgi:putative restriction endonuclease
LTPNLVGIYIGNTDIEWFDFLAEHSDVQEINFWRPSASNFGAIAMGELFAFRLKSPRNKIGGFGVFTNSSLLPIQLAWDAFGQMNGVPSLQAMIQAIAKYRANEAIAAPTFIGCRVLVQPIFFPESLWFDLPASLSGNIVGGKRYDTDTSEGSALWEELQKRALMAGVGSKQRFETDEVQAPYVFDRYGQPTLVLPRLGQGSFRVAITEAYQRQCALTDGKVLPALDAAHIHPYAEGGLHVLSNGVLLRKDIHSVFDAGYATIDENFKFVVSEKVREVFDNGNEYRRLHGRPLRLPSNPDAKPAIASIQWHNSNRYLG